MLELYQAKDWPYCTEMGRRRPNWACRVRSTIRSQQAETDETSNPHPPLPVDLSGQDQIPVLVDHQRGETLSESDAIGDDLEPRDE